MPTPGEALSDPSAEGELDVKLGALRARINVKQIERVEPANGDPEAPAYRPPVQAFPAAIAPELDLRGLTVDEALTLTDQRLDEAARAGVSELRIIHGKGTGTLRHEVRAMLREHPSVRGYRPAAAETGGGGVTEVDLRV